jgi:hypothetical protein
MLHRANIRLPRRCVLSDTLREIEYQFFTVNFGRGRTKVVPLVQKARLLSCHYSAGHCGRDDCKAYRHPINWLTAGKEEDVRPKTSD